MPPAAANQDLDTLIQEFLADPFGDHSPNLQRLLMVLRSAPAVGKYVLVEVVPYRQWRLARLRDRGEPVEMLDTTFDDLAAAERHVFLLRCKALHNSGGKAP